MSTKKLGRPKSCSTDQLIDAFFYVLVENVSWRIASKLVYGNYIHKSTLNKQFNKQEINICCWQ